MSDSENGLEHLKQDWRQGPSTPAKARHIQALSGESSLASQLEEAKKERDTLQGLLEEKKKQANFLELMQSLSNSDELKKIFDKDLATETMSNLLRYFTLAHNVGAIGARAARKSSGEHKGDTEDQGEMPEHEEKVEEPKGGASDEV